MCSVTFIFSNGNCVIIMNKFYPSSHTRSQHFLTVKMQKVASGYVNLNGRAVKWPMFATQPEGEYTLIFNVVCVG